MKLFILIPVFLLFITGSCKVTKAKAKAKLADKEMAIPNNAGANNSGRIGTIPEVLKSFKNIHPRLYMTAQSQKILKSKMTSQPYSALLEKLKTLADRAVLSGAPAYRPGRDNDEQLWQRDVGNAIPELAMAYCMTGITKYLNAARDYMLASASYPTWGTGDIDNSDLAAGHQLYGIALGYDWLYSDLDDASRDSIRNCLIRRGGRLYDLLAKEKVWWHNSYLHNHQHVNLTGLATAGLALYGENADVDGWILVPLEKFRRVIAAMPPDGGWLEGIPYSGYSIEYLMKFMTLSHDLLSEDFFKNSSFFRKIASFRLYAMIPRDYWEASNSRLMTLGDSPRSDYYGPDYLLRKLASEYNDGNAQWLANKMDSAGYSVPLAFFLNLLWINPDIKPKSPDTLPLFKYFNDLDIVYMRSGWDGKESLSMFKCGPYIGHYAASQNFSYGGHSHPDEGTFQIFSHGDWMIADEGYAWKRTIYQNTLVINGKGQMGEGRWFNGDLFLRVPEQPRIVYTRSDEDYDYVIGNVKPAYPSSTHLTSFYRHLLYLKPDCWVVADEVKADSLSLFEFYYHSDFPFNPDGEHRFKVEGTRGNMTMTLLKPKDAATQTFLQEIEGTGGRIARRMSALKVSSAGKLNDLFVIVLEAYPGGQSALIKPSIISSKNEDYLVLESKDRVRRFKIATDRADKNTPLFIEVGKPSGSPALSKSIDYDPDLWLPDTIHLALGNTIELYNDNIAYIRLNDTLIHFKWEHTKGISDNKKFSWTADQVGNVNLTIKCFYFNELIDSATTVLKVVDKKITDKKNLLAIGNSLTGSGFVFQFPQITDDLHFPLNPIGTQGTVYKHEGHGGWMFSTFLSNNSPFFIQNEINFKKYIEDNSLPNPDIIRISLGINDCFGKTTLDKIVIDAGLLIDTINYYYPNSLIIIALPTLCESTGAGWIASYGNLENFEPYQLRIRELWKRLFARYSYGRYKPNIQISYDGLFIDRSNGYPINNGVHPNETGNRQLIRGLSNTLNYYLNNNDSSINTP